MTFNLIFVNIYLNVGRGDVLGTSYTKRQVFIKVYKYSQCSSLVTVNIINVPN